VPPVWGHVRRVFVKAQSRRCGVARKLLKPLCAFFASQDVAGVSLHYLLSNKLGKRFWTDLGFEPFLINAKTTLAELTEKL